MKTVVLYENSTDAFAGALCAMSYFKSVNNENVTYMQIEDFYSRVDIDFIEGSEVYILGSVGSFENSQSFKDLLELSSTLICFNTEFYDIVHSDTQNEFQLVRDCYDDSVYKMQSKDSVFYLSLSESICRMTFKHFENANEFKDSVERLDYLTTKLHNYLKPEVNDDMALTVFKLLSNPKRDLEDVYESYVDVPPQTFDENVKNQKANADMMLDLADGFVYEAAIIDFMGIRAHCTNANKSISDYIAQQVYAKLGLQNSLTYEVDSNGKYLNVSIVCRDTLYNSNIEYVTSIFNGSKQDKTYEFSMPISNLKRVLNGEFNKEFLDGLSLDVIGSDDTLNDSQSTTLGVFKYLGAGAVLGSMVYAALTIFKG